MNKRTIRGFTLIEMIVVIAIFSIVGSALSYMIQYFYRANDYVLQEQTAVASGRQGLTTAMENLREASYGDDGSYPISTAATSSMTFYADVNGTGDVEKVSYYLSSGTLYRGVITAVGTPPSYAGQAQSTSTIATYVVNATSTPIFQYYDNQGNLLTSPVNVSLISSVNTTLKIDVNPNRSPSTYTLMGSATLRNLRSNS
ncbi:MAG: type II secretion system protein [Candidatus Pacebacteria bacterium]|nr:type II secretion system protein [Candidatus Paceibacterota bacterium]